MRSARGIVFALLLFLAAFALHIVGGATDQDWLFAIAVVLIFVVASSFAFIAALLEGTPLREAKRPFFVTSIAIALVLTEATLWAARFGAWRAAG